MNRYLLTVAPAIMAVTLGLYGCSDDSARSSAQEFSTPMPQAPTWLQLQPGTKALLSTSDPTDPVLGSTVLACSDDFSYQHHDQEDDPGGCAMRDIGQEVTIKSHSDGSDTSAVRGDGWSGVVGDSSLSPVIPAGVIMDCSISDNGLNAPGMQLYSKESPRHHIYALRGGDEYVKVLRTRSSADLIGPYVKVMKGYGAGDVGYVRQDELDSCFLKGTIQVEFTH